MPLTLKIENLAGLPDGGPLTAVASPEKGLEIGRDQFMDLALPDPARVVSGRHCEIAWRDGAYWLLDHSTNGTFVNGAEYRVANPHRLADGDKIEIGNYSIRVAISPDAGGAAPAVEATRPSVTSGDLWSVGAGAAPAVPAREFKAPAVRADEPFSAGPVSGEFWTESAPVVPPRPAPAAPGMAPPRPSPWSAPPPQAFAPPEPAPAAPRPARPPTMPAAAPLDVAASEPPEPSFAPPPDAGDATPRGFSAPIALSDAVAPTQPPMSRTGSADEDFIARFAAGAGLPRRAVVATDAGALAEYLGAIMRDVAEHLRQMQEGRARSKGAIRSSRHTMIEAADNNPLRFTPSAADALRIMFGEPTAGYLDAKRAIDSSLADAKRHQLLIFASMQAAVGAVTGDLDPKKIEASVPAGGLLGSRKVKLWDAYVAAWTAKSGSGDKGLMDAFLRAFAEAYDKAH